MTNISDEAILKLWRSPLFTGSFSGVKTFKICLKLEKDIDVSESRLYSILKTDPIFIIHQKRHKELDRRHLDLNNYGELVFGDLAIMYPYDGFQYFLLVVDGFSSKIFVRPLKAKNSVIVAKALGDIFDEFNAQIYVFETGKSLHYNKFYLGSFVMTNLCKVFVLSNSYSSLLSIHPSIIHPFFFPFTQPIVILFCTKKEHGLIKSIILLLCKFLTYRSWKRI